MAPSVLKKSRPWRANAGVVHVAVRLKRPANRNRNGQDVHTLTNCSLSLLEGWLTVRQPAALQFPAEVRQPASSDGLRWAALNAMASRRRRSSGFTLTTHGRGP